MRLIIHFLSLFIFTVQAFIIPDVPTVQLVQTIDLVRRATMPGDFETAVAVGASEAIAGAIGGLASRGTASFIGDRKIDTVQTKVTVTGAFFGVRGLTLVFCKLLGLPSSLSNIFSSIAASIISEFTKAAGRSLENVDSSEQLKSPEVLGDITKWLVYNFLEDTFLHEISCNIINDTLYGAGFGALAAVSGRITQDFFSYLLELNAKSSPEFPLAYRKRPLKEFIARDVQVLVEGAALFGCYKLFGDIESKTIPEQFNKRFIFNEFVKMIEEKVSEF